MKNKSLVITMLLITVLVACMKEVQNDKSENRISNIKTKEPSKLGIVLDYQGYLKDYAIYGKWHNEVMEEVGKAIDVNNPNPVEIYNVLKRELEKEHVGYQYHSYNQYVQSINNGELRRGQKLKISADIGEAYNLLPYSIKDMISEFELHYNLLLDPSKIITPDEFVTGMFVFEVSIMSKYGAPTLNNGELNDVGMMLAASSVAKASYEYWYNALKNVDATWYGIFNNPNNPNDEIQMVSGWWERVKADIRGWFVGGVTWHNGGYGGATIDLGDAQACSNEYSASI